MHQAPTEVFICALISENTRLFELDTDEDDMIDYLNCAIQDLNWVHAHHQAKLVFEVYYPVIKRYISSGRATVSGLKLIPPFMETYLPYIMEGSSSETFYNQYATQITNYVLTYNELLLWVKGASTARLQNGYIDLDVPIHSIDDISKTYYNDVHDFDKRCSDWNIIKKYLQKDDLALVLVSFTNPYTNVPLVNAFKFNTLSESPERVVDFNIQEGWKSMDVKTPYEGTPKGKTYVCYVDGSEEIQDFDWGNNDIYRKFSLFDIGRNWQKNAKNKYEGGTVYLCADINYGKGLGNARPLDESKRLINIVKESFSNKAYILSDDNVRKINFFNIVDDVQILHISTHGMMDSGYLIDEKSRYTQNVFENVGNEVYLCLSNYNTNPQRNRLTATEIQEQITLHNNCLVFLDACNTNGLRKTYSGSNSLAKSFRIAGAQYVIAYLNSVNEKVATDFAVSFYGKISSNPDITYHQAFYQTKQYIYNKYKDSGMLTSRHGKPSFEIVFWE